MEHGLKLMLLRPRLAGGTVLQAFAGFGSVLMARHSASCKEPAVYWSTRGRIRTVPVLNPFLCCCAHHASSFLYRKVTVEKLSIIYTGVVL